MMLLSSTLKRTVIPLRIFNPLRTLSSSSSSSTANADFHAASETILQRLLHRIESSEPRLPAHFARSFDCEYSQGVLTVRFSPQTCYVLNKQPPNAQIWLSSPFSGPRRFALDGEGKWMDVRDSGWELEKLIEREFWSELEFELVK